jgi:hypothetical protein
MNNDQNNQTFHYTYSAAQQQELKRIRQKYLPPEEDKMAQIRRLDASVYNKACVLALVVGVLGALILGVGMCCVLVWDLMAPGIIVGVLGIGVCAPAYPLYLYVTKKERTRVAPEILRLTDELMK